MSTALAVKTSSVLAIGADSEEFQITARFMAQEYHEATEEIRRLADQINRQTHRLQDAFDPGNDFAFGLDIEYSGKRTRYRNGMDEILGEMKRRAWRVLAVKLGIFNVMSVKRRKEFEQQLNDGDLPEITEDTIVGVILGLADQAKDFAVEAAKEVFDILRPRGGWGGQYKTNDAFRVGKRVILPYRIERVYGGVKYRPNYRNQQELTAIDGVFHLLDGKGVIREHMGPLCQAIEASPNGKGETEFFKFKCFRNGNLHLEMKRLDLVKQLNGLAAGEYVLGDDTE